MRHFSNWHISEVLESLHSSFSSWFFLSSRIRHLFLSQAWAYRFVLFFWCFFATKETTNDETTNDETTNWHIVIFIFLCHFVISFVRCFLSLSIRHFSQTTNATRSSFVISSSTPPSQCQASEAVTVSNSQKNCSVPSSSVQREGQFAKTNHGILRA